MPGMTNPFYYEKDPIAGARMEAGARKPRKERLKLANPPGAGTPAMGPQPGEFAKRDAALKRRNEQVKDYIGRMSSMHVVGPKSGPGAAGDIGLGTEHTVMEWQPERLRSKLMRDWDAPIAL